MSCCLGPLPTTRRLVRERLTWEQRLGGPPAQLTVAVAKQRFGARVRLADRSRRIHHQHRVRASFEELVKLSFHDMPPYPRCHASTARGRWWLSSRTPVTPWNAVTS